MTDGELGGTSFAVQVRWSDADELGHVNHARYLTYFEDARMAVAYASPAAGVGVGGRARGAYVAARVAVDYRRQVRFQPGLVVTVRTGLGRLGNSSLTLLQKLYLPGEAQPVAECECVLVAYDYAADKSRPLDADERDYWQGLP